MKIIGPDRFSVTIDSGKLFGWVPDKSKDSSSNARAKGPKLYVVSVGNKPIYVGATTQPIRNRIRSGIATKREQNKTGYNGYPWKNLSKVEIDVWYLLNFSEETKTKDIETIEGEVVFLIRSSGAWPEYQTEIHFHKSDKIHHNIAESILKHYA